MKNLLYAIVVIFFSCSYCTSKRDNLALWYDQQASGWNEALPLGNGRMGAMVFGGITKEHLQLNENTYTAGNHLKIKLCINR